MLVKLMKHELIKRWKFARYLLIGCIALQALLLIITRVFLWDSNIVKVADGGMKVASNNSAEIPFVIAMMIYFLSAVLLFIYPMIESAYYYERDLSGKQAVFELMIPVVSWRKIISKLVVSTFSTIAYMTLAAFSGLIFILVNNNFDRGMIATLFADLGNALHSPIKCIWYFLCLIFSFVSMYLMIFLCISFAKSISHKNQIATPIGILVFVLLMAAFAYLQMQAEKFPIFEFSIFDIKGSISSTLLEFGLFALTFIGTSWLTEKKIEY